MSAADDKSNKSTTPPEAEDDSLSVKHVARDVAEDFRAEGRAIKNFGKNTSDTVHAKFRRSDEEKF